MRRWKLILCFCLYLSGLHAQYPDRYVLDMVHHNPGEALTKSVFTDPTYLKSQGYTGQVVNDFTFAHTAITFDSFDKSIFPVGSEARKWVMASAAKVRENIAAAKKEGIKCYYFTDLIVLPKTLVAKYKDQLCDSLGRISLDRPLTVQLHKLMLDELFAAFADLDGLVIRTGETYLNNVPYHTGNNPITNGVASHIKLLELLREEVCVKRNKKIFYRTWSFGGMHSDPKYYLSVVNAIAPHPNLIFSIKHTIGDYHRTFDFNPTLGLGSHPQIVEVQAQREYEGKGAYPNYVMDGVINGFEEYRNGSRPQKGYMGLDQLKSLPTFAGVWSWSRGGGWVGPYISNEFWCRLNAFVISRWGGNTAQTEEQVFDAFMDQQGIAGSSCAAFRKLCLLSAKAVIRGHGSAMAGYESKWVWWMRDEFLSGTDEGPLADQFKVYYDKRLLERAVDEKYEAVALWKEIVSLSSQISLRSAADQKYLEVSSRYGLLLHQVIASGWKVMALGYQGDRTGKYDKMAIRTAIAEYDLAWKNYTALGKSEPSSATLYKPFGFVYQAPDYYGVTGMGPSVDRYRRLSAIKLPVYLDPKAAVALRVKDLLARMTLEEKIGQMCQFVGLEHIKSAQRGMSAAQLKNSDANAFYPGLDIAAIEQIVREGKTGSFLHVVDPNEANALQKLAASSRLQIPLILGIDAVHGNGMVTGTTVYPSPIGLASTFDTLLVRKLSIETAREMRATGTQWSFAPNLDVAHDPRWGRVGETFGEDPMLVTAMGVSMIKGLQGDHSGGKLDILACAKHLVGGSVSLGGLNVAPADISERSLKEIFLPPFRAAVDAGVFSVMPAHNEINGIPSHAAGFLMEELLRKNWNYKGFFVSDWMDIERLVGVHKVAADQTDAVLQTVTAGMDMHMHGPGFFEPLLKLVKAGKISANRVDASVSRILEAKFRLGLFENPFTSTGDANKNTVFATEHQKTALEAARKSIVLLKNEKNILPLTGGKYKNILVTGTNAHNQTILGDWAMPQPDEKVITILEGIKQQAPEGVAIDFADVGNSAKLIATERIQAALEKAGKSDLIVVALGENSLRYTGRERTSGENMDIDQISLPPSQIALLKGLFATGKPVILVLVNGRPLELSGFEGLSAIIEAWEPGSFGGRAVAEVIFGKINPSGKLPISFPRNAGQIPLFYNHKPSQYVRTYVFGATGPLYEFGYGMSYTSFAYAQPTLSHNILKKQESTTLAVKVENTGKVAGDEVVQLYLSYPVSMVARPVKTLIGFKRVGLKPGEAGTVNFTITPTMLSALDVNFKAQIQNGTYVLMVGSSSADSDLQKINLTLIP